MGLDISLVKFVKRGTDRHGNKTLTVESFHHPKWNSDRLAIRHQLSKNIDWEYLRSEAKYDLQEYYRPENFEDAYKWANSLEKEGEKAYVINILDILKENPEVYLDYGY